MLFSVLQAKGYKKDCDGYVSQSYILDFINKLDYIIFISKTTAC